MIELVRSQLDEREQKRWRAALAETPLVGRPARVIDPELPMFGAILWIVPFVLTFERWESPPSALSLGVVRAVCAAAWLVSARAGLYSWRARNAVWPSGRFLFRWGYAEIEHDVMRLVPMAELEHVIRGRLFGIGAIHLGLHAGRWSTSFGLRPDEVEQVSTAFEDGSTARLGLLTEGYREGASTIDGPRARRKLPRPARELAWTVVAAIAGMMLPTGMGAEEPSLGASLELEIAPNPEGFRAPYAAALRRRQGHLRPAVSIELERCSPAPVVVSTIASYLRLALTTHNRGPAHPFVPALGVRPPRSARVWADCTWEVDQDNGTLLRARARWGLDRDGETLVERRATVEIGDVIGLIDSTSLAQHDGMSPEGLAAMSLVLIEGTILEDLYEGAPPLTHSPVGGRFLAEAVAQVAVTRVRDPSHAAPPALR